jgi:hypothetical protein
MQLDPTVRYLGPDRAAPVLVEFQKSRECKAAAELAELVELVGPMSWKHAKDPYLIELWLVVLLYIRAMVTPPRP